MEVDDFGKTIEVRVENHWPNTAQSGRDLTIDNLPTILLFNPWQSHVPLSNTTCTHDTLHARNSSLYICLSHSNLYKWLLRAHISKWVVGEQLVWPYWAKGVHFGKALPPIRKRSRYIGFVFFGCMYLFACLHALVYHGIVYNLIINSLVLLLA